MAPKKAQAKKPQKKAAVKRPPEKEPESSPRRTSARHESQDSPQAGSATPSPSHRALVLSSPARLRVQVPNSGSQSSLEAGLVQLRRNRQLCDVTIASGFGKILAHKSVLAAHSEILARQLQDLTELDLRQASHEAVEFVGGLRSWVGGGQILLWRGRTRRFCAVNFTGQRGDLEDLVGLWVAGA
ncbi:unnamed protein product, partial [Durusdinium trenchii]